MPRGITIHSSEGKNFDISAYDLYFNAPARRDPISGQRLGSTLDDRAEVRITDISSEENGSAILFDTGERLSSTWNALHGLVASPEPGARPVLWDPALAVTLPTFT